MIFFLIFFLIILYWAEKYSLAHAFDRVTLESTTDKALVEPDEPFCWSLSIENKKRMMVPYFKIRERVPEGLSYVDGGQPVERREKPGLTSALYLAGRQKTVLERQVRLGKRGRYFFRGASAEAGDFCGLKSCVESYPELKEIIVKPRPFPGPEFRELLGGYLGEYSARNRLLEDPILTVGFREYTGREPMKSISWNQSARNNRLLVKKFDCTLDPSCTVFLDTGCADGAEKKTLLERCYSMARSACEELEWRRISYDFRTNGVIAGTMGNWEQVGEGLGPKHLAAVLEGLGRMTYDCREPLADCAEKAARSVRAGHAWILITPKAGPGLDAVRRRLEAVCGTPPLIMTAEGTEG